MKKLILIFTLLAVSFYSQTLFAQKFFSEGIIKYDVYKNGSSKPDGIYMITVKSGMIKQEWAMNNGFNNVTIYNQKTGVTLSLNMKNGMKYALEISTLEMIEKNKRFENATFQSSENSKKVAGYSCTETKVDYTNGESVSIYYTADLLPQNPSFNTMFPGLKGIALEYITKASKDISFKFIATLVDIKVVDNSVFVIPSDYKIVSKSDLEKLK